MPASWKEHFSLEFVRQVISQLNRSLRKVVFITSKTLALAVGLQELLVARPCLVQPGKADLIEFARTCQAACFSFGISR